MIQQMNAVRRRRPVANGDGSQAHGLHHEHRRLADSQQCNETLWVRTAARGRQAQPQQRRRQGHLLEPALPRPARCHGAAEAARYTGVQDYNDYVRGPLSRSSTTPTSPDRASYAAWPKYPGLMNKAQQPFKASGLNVPGYVVFGNHDALVQGNADASRLRGVREGLPEADRPVAEPAKTPRRCSTSLLNPANLLSLVLTEPQNTFIVPRRPERQSGLQEAVQGHLQGRQPGRRPRLRLRRPGCRKRPRTAPPATTRWSPKPGIRFITLDTVSEAGKIVTPAALTAEGNLDDPQFNWLEGQLKAATAADQLVVLFCHHAPESLNADVPDELAPPCLLVRVARARRQSRLRRRPAPLVPDPPRGRRGRPSARIPQRDRLGRRPLPRERRSTPSPTRRATAASGASASPPRPTGRSRAACCRSSTTTTAPSRSSARSSTTPASRRRRRPAPRPRDGPQRPRLGRPHDLLQRPTGRRPRRRRGADDRNVELLVDDPR